MPAVTSGLVAGEEAMVGRGAERRQVEGLLESGGRLLLVGDAGIGKTTLWRHGVDRARSRGAVVLVSAPAEAEQTFSFAVLGDLLEPIADEVLPGLPAPQRRALEAALLRIDEAGEADLHTVGVAVASALRCVSSPLLVAVDDVQWVDSASAAALEFALRRLDSAACLFALRRGTHPRLQLPAKEVDVGPLSVGAIHHLLVERLGVALSRPALLRVHELSGGNPFYALELARSGSEALPASLKGVVADRIGALPEDTRRALAVLSLAGTAPSEADLAPAVEAGVLLVSGGPVRFAHPLLAEAAVELLGLDERRALHRQIADTSPDRERAARHLAMAATAPDEEIAAALADAARSAGSRIATAELWELAAELTPPDRDELVAERLCEAGIAHILAGNPDHAASLLDANLPRLSDGPLRQRGSGHLAFMLGRKDVTLIVEKLEQTIAEITDLRAWCDLTGLLCGTVASTGDVARASRIAEECLARVERSGDEALLAWALTTAAVFRFTLDRPAWDLLERARALDPDATERAALTASHRDGRIDDARAILERARERSGQQTIYHYHWLVSNLALTELAAGRWEQAEAYADEALAIGEQIGAPYMVCIGLTCSANVDAVCGRPEDARRKAGRALEVAEGIRAGMHADYARLTLGLVELSLGRYGEACDVYRQLDEPFWHRLSWFVGARPAVDAVEAFTALGELDAARAIAARLPDDARERAVVGACVAAAEGDFERAIGLLRGVDPAPAPFRRARELLLLGGFLRRARSRSEAREVLTEARAEFERLGARCWVERTDEEAGRLGGRSPAGQALTASELRVAELVAEGLSNKEVAVRLVVTVRTVEAHLSKIYAKLGVRSRTELAAAWNAQTAE